MYCRRCGKEIPDDSLVCPYCGTRVVLDTNDAPLQNNTMAIVGLITAFISPILGWIFGGIGLKRSDNGYNGRRIALLAIIIATINFGINIYMIATGQLDDIIKQFM